MDVRGMGCGLWALRAGAKSSAAIKSVRFMKSWSWAVDEGMAGGGWEIRVGF
jgi:hypothetical protein